MSLIKDYKSCLSMNGRKRMTLLVIPVVCVILISAGYLTIKTRRQKKQSLLIGLIHSLEEYKLSNGTYPLNISKIDSVDVDWLYYSRDSTGQSFTLTYSSGIMNVNTFRYTSKTKSWEEIFNY